MIDIEQIKKLRDETGFSLVEIKKALEKASGNFQKAKEILKTLNSSLSETKKINFKNISQGIVDSYIHPNAKMGVLLEIRCETDFVAKSEEFKNLAHEICLQIAAMKPLYVKDDDIPAEVIEEEKKNYQKQLIDSGKSQNIIDQILEGKIKKYKESVSLMLQKWIKDDSKTVKELINQVMSKTGEKIEIKKFIRYEI